jgi:PAS domain S-box-containing protein
MADLLRTIAGAGDSGVRRLLLERDWSASPLGAPAGWPPELATAVSMAASSAFPMFVAWGPDLCFLYNDAYVPILGDKHPRAFGMPFREVWSEVWAELVPIVDRALSNKPVYFENLVLTLERHGYPEPAWFTFSYAPLHDGQGRVAGLYCTCNETTDLVRANAALRAERDRGQLILDSIAEGFVLVDRDWTVLQVNNAGLRLAGRTADQALGRHHWAVWPEAQDSTAGRMYQRAMRERVAGRVEYLHPLPDGSQVWLEVRAYPSRDGGLVCFFLDISERKQAEDKLRAADQRKDEFLAMLAHELRNPLAPISAAADLLRIGRLDEARVRQSSAIIGRQVRHMTSLVDDLLDVSRVTRGLVTLAQAPVAARTIVDEAVEQVRPMFEARRQQLAVRIVDPDATVLGDKARLVQVLSNLLNNAAKYSPEGLRIEVEAVADSARARLLLAVRDEGIGMERELTGHVFDLFSQAQRSSDRSQGGLGLGLALVKSLVELHGGTVCCSSPGLGQGSSFEVELPLIRASAQQAGVTDGGQRFDGAGRPLRLLVVDDNVDAASTLGMLLEASGYEVEVQNASPAALNSALDHPPDAALLDIGIPEMDGNELARRLRADARTRGMVLIAVTGYGQEQDRQDALGAGFDHHLVKPVDMARLAGVLAAVEAARG